MTQDIFDHAVLCNKCEKKMKKLVVERNGFKMRALECPNCGQRTYHPSDLEEQTRFNQLKGQNFKVKLRQVGNSYAISIPRELLNFLSEAQEEKEQRPREDPFAKQRNDLRQMHEHMERMVTLALEQSNKLSLSFGQEGNYDRTKEYVKGDTHTIVREKAETRPIDSNGGKGFISRKIKVVRMRRSE
jgi:rRNA maturation protein Nop10